MSGRDRRRPAPPQRPPQRIEERLARRGGPVELLRLPAAVFGAASALRGRLYDRGWLPSERLEVPVVSVGNLTAGGTGKTPMVVWLVRELARRGLRPGIVSRGYRAERGSAGDEARMLSELARGVPHVQDSDRARGGRSLAPLADVIVLDDAFQHRRLARDLDLCLVDATRPWGLPAVQAFLPRGLLREAPGALARAGGVVLTRVDQVSGSEREALSEEIRAWAPGVPLMQAVHRPARLRRLGGGEDSDPRELAGREVDLVSGIAHPGAFEALVRSLGAEVVEHRRFPDHHAYGPGDLDGLGSPDGARWVVTTSKDAVKLAGSAVMVLEVELAVVEGASVLSALLDSLPLARSVRERGALHGGLHG